MKAKTNRIRVAEVTSTVGAGILGTGLGVLFEKYLSGLGAVLLVFGALMHAWGMFDMRRMEGKAASVIQPTWSKVLYWLCWLTLLALLIFLMFESK